MRSYRPNRWIFRERFFSGTKFVKKAWKIPFSKETTRTRDHASRDRLAVTISSCATVSFFFPRSTKFSTFVLVDEREKRVCRDL